MKKHLSTKSSGYTLLEVMVAMTILMITLGTLLGMSVSPQGSANDDDWRLPYPLTQRTGW